MSDVEKPIFASNIAVHEKLSNEAASRGLILTGYSERGPSYRKYNFICCGHSQDILTSNVRKNTPVCEQCRSEKLAHLLETLNLEFVKSITSNRAVYKFKGCGHIKEVHLSNLTRNSVECKECLLVENVKVAQSRNLELIGDSEIGPLYKKYRFFDCGHTADLQKSNVRSGKFYCKTCKDISLALEAAEHDIELVGESDRGARYRVYKFICGHTADIKTEMVRNGVCNCPVCGETSWSKPSYTYVFKIQVGDFSWLKVGYARSLSFRKRRYGLPPGANVEELFTKRHETGKLADQYETEILCSIKEYNIDRDVMLKYMTESGSTECFTLDALPLIEKYFNQNTTPTDHRGLHKP